MTQRSLFDTDPTRQHFSDPQLDAKEKPRLSRQCRDILRMLVAGPQSNGALAAVALKYTGRISDIRKNGISVIASSRNFETGLVTYCLPSEADRERALTFLEMEKSA